MMSKTHLMVGVASAVAVIQPKTVPEMMVASIGGSIGGILADVDVDINTENKYARKYSMDAIYGQIIVLLFVATWIAFDYLTTRFLINDIISH